MSALIVVFPRGQLASKDKERLTKRGIIAVEADDPNQVRMLSLEMCGITSNDVLRAAMTALSSQSSSTGSGYITEAGRQKSNFVTELAKGMKP